MQATVIRNGSHLGELFVEVTHSPDGAHASPLVYAVPVSTELPIGTVVDIVVTVAEVPKTEPTAEDFGDVSIPTAEPFVVENSPIVGDEAPKRVPTQPCGSPQSTDGERARKDAHIADEQKGGPQTPVSAERNEGRSTPPAAKGAKK
jgi:hypothetical protein